MSIGEGLSRKETILTPGGHFTAEVKYNSEILNNLVKYQINLVPDLL